VFCIDWVNEVGGIMSLEQQAFESIVKNYFRALLDEGRAHLANPTPAFVNAALLVEPEAVSITPTPVEDMPVDEAMPIDEVKLVDDEVKPSPGFLSRITGFFKRKRENEVLEAVESHESLPDVNSDSKMKDEEMKEPETLSPEDVQPEIEVELPKKRMRTDNKDKEELTANESKVLTLDDAGIEKLRILFSKLDSVACDARMAKEEEERHEMQSRNVVIENLSKIFNELESVRGLEEDSVDVPEPEVIDLTDGHDLPQKLKRKPTSSTGTAKRRRKS
jgi:hypothetical protein